ncbi:MAG TPA: DUF4926 domain-containing protein [Hanamia sp.]|nr:DUF4926 domain-containing protein [Hanamia sp.]
MFKEFDSIIAKKDLENIPKGTKGVILMVFETLKDYEVEFLTEEGETINFLTVNENDIELRQNYK